MYYEALIELFSLGKQPKKKKKSNKGPMLPFFVRYYRVMYVTNYFNDITKIGY